MSKYSLILHVVNDAVNDLTIKPLKMTPILKLFSEPKIYTGGVDIKKWNKLSAKVKKEALNKPWFVYYSFRNPDTGKLQRMPHIKAGINKHKTKEIRYACLVNLRKAIQMLLENGYNPFEYVDPELIRQRQLERYQKELISQNSTKKRKKVVNTESFVEHKIENIEQNNETSIKDAVSLVLSLKEKTLSKMVFLNFKNRILNFSKRFDQNKSITSIDKKAVNIYLNEILIQNTPRTRNNHRTDLSSFFQLLEDNDIITSNFIKRIPVLKAEAEKNKTYTPVQEKEIFEFLEQNDPLLLLYIKFISYNFLRPVEVNRLFVRDIDLKDKKLYVKTKNKALKTKIIPDILLQELEDLKNLNPNHLLFTPNGLGLEWEADENNRRDSFSKRFKNVVKDHFKLGNEYGLYSFRHTFITKLYRNLREEKSPFETKSILMNITGHTTMDALEKYLRDIDAELPNDYSLLLK